MFVVVDDPNEAYAGGRHHAGISGPHPEVIAMRTSVHSEIKFVSRIRRHREIYRHTFPRASYRRELSWMQVGGYLTVQQRPRASRHKRAEHSWSEFDDLQT